MAVLDRVESLRCHPAKERVEDFVALPRCFEIPGHLQNYL
jgi:hypothetical protein